MKCAGLIVTCRCWTYVLLVLIITVGRAGAQDTPSQAFETFSLTLSGVAHVNENDLQAGWHAPRGLEVRLETPFYWGQVRAGLQLLPYASRRGDVPDFQGRHLFMDWGLPVRLVGPLYLLGGVRLGLFQMHFDDMQGTNQQVEQEVAMGGVGEVHYALGRSWQAHVGAGYGRVYLQRTLPQAFVTIGLSRAFTMPRWLQEVLR